MPYIGKWIEVGETTMPHFDFGHRGDFAKTSENIFSGNLIADSSRQ